MCVCVFVSVDELIAFVNRGCFGHFLFVYGTIHKFM